MREREELIEWVRAEIIGPSRPLKPPQVVSIQDGSFMDTELYRSGPLAWRPAENEELQEILYFERESPHRRYGAGLLHPRAEPLEEQPEQEADEPDATDMKSDEDQEEQDASDAVAGLEPALADQPASDDGDDFEVTSDVYQPSTLAISFCVKLSDAAALVVTLPRNRRFFWQSESAPPMALNGRYEPVSRRFIGKEGDERSNPAWRRQCAVAPSTQISVSASEIRSLRIIEKAIPTAESSPLRLLARVYARPLRGNADTWLITVVLCNISDATRAEEATLYQTYFEVSVSGGQFRPYPESERPFAQRDADEQSLALLYRSNATWAIGHGCAAGWRGSGDVPEALFSDVLPAVELPSMTAEIEVDGRALDLSMASFAALSDNGSGPAWSALESLRAGYRTWIEARRGEVGGLPQHLRVVAQRHLADCETCLTRIEGGIELLREDGRLRKAFRLANLAMLLQQISTKQFKRREFLWDEALKRVTVGGEHESPWSIHASGTVKGRLGNWRAFQMAFLLMSLRGVCDERSSEREIVDLIWFPTGGGKTEAYLAVMAVYMFHQRLMEISAPRRDGTNVLMRYTLRMLTTQQFQRAASLICAMEFLRRHPELHHQGSLAGRRFSLGLWIGGDGSPNDVKEAKRRLGKFRHGDLPGNPLVLTECPWCRASIGRFDERPRTVRKDQWHLVNTVGIRESKEGPVLACPDPKCEFGQQTLSLSLPVEVIDTRIYADPPSLIIATADKLAMIAFKPETRSLFGREVQGNHSQLVARPPGLIIQDELHLISGPLGSLYSLYEAVFERFCSIQLPNGFIKPKIIASTATIRGAASQVRTLYARDRTCLFPSPGLSMGDSFFGTYAREKDGSLRKGRLYLGIHANDYGSILTTQVRAFSAIAFRVFEFDPARRDAWWTLLAFYNSLRELGGARTLFDSDIRSRLKFMFNREGYPLDRRRRLQPAKELTSRLSQAEIVAMMDELGRAYETNREALDACLASNIIEVGVDIDRLSLMGIVGQPKTTATYIQVSGRVGRRWEDRPGLILTLYNPGKSRDRSHFEQFHSYHRRLYERVEPTSATPFAVSALERALAGVLLTWVRHFHDAPVAQWQAYDKAADEVIELLKERCRFVQRPEDQARSLARIDRLRKIIAWKWKQNPLQWQAFPPSIDGKYLMLWPGQYATKLQEAHGLKIPSSMRQVDRTAELIISEAYALEIARAALDDPMGMDQDQGV